MKKNGKTKNLLTASVGLLAATSVVAPLSAMTSCTNAKTNIEFAVDKEYGVTETTYLDLRDEFKAQYKAALENQSIETKEHIAHLEKQLASLDEIKNQKTHGFTTLTSSMMNFSKIGRDLDGNEYKSFNLHLNRKTNAQWSQLDTIFNSWKGAFKQYMLNSDLSLSTITRVMQDAQNKFINLKNNLIETCDDALDGVLKGKELLITCFDDVNDEIALVSATLQLKELMDQYVFDVKTNDPAACLDNILKDPDCNFAVGNILTDTTMNKLFTLTRKDDLQPVEFKNTLIKGYTIQPVLDKVFTNKYANINTFQIKFGIVKTSYLGRYNKDKLASVTGHIYSADNWGSLSKVDDNTTLDQLIQNLEIQNSEYPIYLTKKAEQDALSETYFAKESDKGHISFVWDNENADNQAYEAFFDNATQNLDGTWTAKLSSNSLINSGLMISDASSSFKLINDVLKSRFNINSNNFDEARSKNLVEAFLMNCEVSANATIDETNTSHKVITINDFYANYKNSIYKDENDGKLELKNDDYTKFQTECVNHQVSKAFFQKVNNKFNDVLNFVRVYDGSVTNPNNNKNEPITEAGLEELEKDTDKEFLAASTSIIAGIFVTAHICYNLWTSWAVPEGKEKLVKVVNLLLTAASVIAQSALNGYWLVNFFHPVNEFLNKYKDFKDDPKQFGLVETLKTSLQDRYVLINKDGSYNKKEFETKRKAFNKLKMTEMLEEYRNYSCIESSASALNSDWNEYQECLKLYGIDPEDELMEKISGWDRGGKYWMIQIYIAIATVALSVVLNLWIRAQKTPVPEEDEIRNSQENMTESQSFLDKLDNDDVNTICQSFQRNCQNRIDFPGTNLKLTVDVPSAMVIFKELIDMFNGCLWEFNYDDIDDDSAELVKYLQAKDLRQFINQKMGTAPTGQKWDISILDAFFGPK